MSAQSPRVWLGRPYIRSRLTFSNPASRAVSTAISAWRKLCRRPMIFNMSLFADCTPIDRRFTPSARRSFSSSSFVVSGFTSTVISESRRTFPMRLSSSRISTMRFAP